MISWLKPLLESKGELTSRVCCRVILRSFASMLGEIDKKQLESSDSSRITIYNAITTRKGLKLTSSVVPKSDVREIVVLEPVHKFSFYRG
jgi:hypothetical protein